MLSKNAQNLIKKYEDNINAQIFLPVFIEALVEGGVELFDELRAVFKEIGVDFKNVDFTRLK